jgi:hypothetical protein
MMLSDINDTVLAIATIFLNGKPTQGDAFGSKVEFAMSLVSNYGYILSSSRLLTSVGSYDVSNHLRCYQWEEYEDDSPVSR